ncbi:RNA polymerase sigma factor [Solibacillus ferritrahens]|uniref:RNA polymerase sigma factor n=1 Tax=Solibacillus ferritrahens TaxID=3098620 RepID=UPI0030080B3F
MTWEELYLEYSDAIHNYILLLVGNHEVAEDLTHDTFVKVKYSLNHFRGESSKKTWLFPLQEILRMIF